MSSDPVYPCSRYAPPSRWPAPPPTAQPVTIVVGVDGSAGSQAALDFAVAEALLRAGTVHAIHAWQYPTTYGDGWIPDGDEFATNAAHILDHAISVAGESAADLGSTPPMVAVLEHGDPAEKLLAAAQDATLLVVGSRGHGGFVGMMLGSVGRHCTIHSPCPVVVVHGPADSAPPNHARSKVMPAANPGAADRAASG